MIYYFICIYIDYREILFLYVSTTVELMIKTQSAEVMAQY